jgi:heat shock protein HslJ
LRYAAASPVGEWEVTAFLNGDALSSPLPGTTLTATFGDDGTLSGSSGCNRYMTTYTTNAGAIEIEPAGGTKMFCPEPEGVMEQEAAYLAALPTAVRYGLDGGSLTLLSADGAYVVAYARRAACSRVPTARCCSRWSSGSCRSPRRRSTPRRSAPR